MMMRSASVCRAGGVFLGAAWAGVSTGSLGVGSDVGSGSANAAAIDARPANATQAAWAAAASSSVQARCRVSTL
ncbi:MAG: hypothetical protein B7Y53_01240 [Halothiobacillus sp. 28-55-5]|nr:MAG: hypothetical protein B7Y53_01240 [Halothiobacillus sp. 28-55-5]